MHLAREAQMPVPKRSHSTFRQKPNVSENVQRKITYMYASKSIFPMSPLHVCVQLSQMISNLSLFHSHCEPALLAERLQDSL